MDTDSPQSALKQNRLIRQKQTHEGLITLWTNLCELGHSITDAQHWFSQLEELVSHPPDDVYDTVIAADTFGATAVIDTAVTFLL